MLQWPIASPKISNYTAFRLILQNSILWKTSGMKAVAVADNQHITPFVPAHSRSGDHSAAYQTAQGL